MMKAIVAVLMAMAFAVVAFAQPAAPPPQPAAVTAAVTVAPVPAPVVPKAVIPPAPAAEPKVATSTPDAPVADPGTGTPEPEPTADQVQEQIKKVLNDWKTLGWMWGLVALCGLLTLLLRIGPVNHFMEAKGLKKFKPWIAGVLGALAGFLSTFATGAGWPQSALLGLMAGLAAVGGHQMLTAGNAKKA